MSQSPLNSLHHLACQALQLGLRDALRAAMACSLHNGQQAQLCKHRMLFTLHQGLSLHQKAILILLQVSNRSVHGCHCRSQVHGVTSCVHMHDDNVQHVED